MRRDFASLGIACLLTLFSSVAVGQDWTDMIRFGGYIDSDTRIILDDYRGATPGGLGDLEMNRNELNLRLGIQPSDSLKAVIDMRLRYFGFNNANDLPDLIYRDKVDPYGVYLDEAYLMVRGFAWENMDLRIGRMIQNWGSVDQFNPTDNLNSRDLSDPLDFTKKVPNQMVELSMYPADWINLTFVWVPLFKPAQLPASANLAFAVEYDQNGCFANAPIPPVSRPGMEELISYFGSLDKCKMDFTDPSVQLLQPERSLANSQAAARAKLFLGPVDVSLSYYYGRFGFPVAYTAVAHATPQVGDPTGQDIAYVAEVMYPRMHVAGIDFSYSADWLFGVGFMGEFALIFPEEVDFGLRAYRGTTVEFDMSNVNVPGDPFWKGTFGFDYTFPGSIYLNAMYVHGFFDEFNDMYGLHDYLVMALEKKFFDDELAIRAAGVWDMTQQETGTATGQITWLVTPGAELQAVAMFFLGDTNPPDRNPAPGDDDVLYLYQDKWRFGQKAAGRNVLSLRARVTW